MKRRKEKHYCCKWNQKQAGVKEEIPPGYTGADRPLFRV
jgi:hypothetical protein